MLPEEFYKRMKQLLGEEAEDFFHSYQEARAYGLRYNPFKFSSRQEFEQNISKLADWELVPVPWCTEGYYYKPPAQPGKHPWHEAGAYYIQEPSAMSAAELLGAEPGEKILDLCAAPGGKTTQIAGKMKGQGLLVSNEYYPNRAKILSQNVERMGIANTVVLNESTEHLRKGFSGFFDRILVDAPCSGEGMFRKDPGAAEEWSAENVEMCAGRQQEILSHAAEMLRPGGVLVYATCTFSPQENEGCLAWFLAHYPEYSLQKVETAEQYFSPGRPEWAVNGTYPEAEIQKDKLCAAYRLWPHKLRGEGHFAAKMVKKGMENKNSEGMRYQEKNRKGRTGKNARIEEAVQLFRDFEERALQGALQERLKGKFTLFCDQLYLIPEEMPDLKGWKVLRAGLHLGVCKKNRFEPSHALALYLDPKQAKQTVEIQAEEALKYLHGETIFYDTEQKGWVLVCMEGVPLGWGKSANGVVKNHYPKGLRMLCG